MFNSRTKKAFSAAMAVMLLLGACGGSSQSQEEIATAVAQTVEAQNALTQVASVPTSAPALSSPVVPEETAPSETGTDVILPTATNTLAPNPGCILSSNLVGEDPPDGTIIKPGESFIKSWSLQNTGTCTWDSTYKLVYWDGDLIGGAVSYPLPEVVAPGETKAIPILLQAPATEGQYRGYWRLKSPWGYDFGVGPASQSFYVDIVAADVGKGGYGAAGVVIYDYDRDPIAGCPTWVDYTFYARISSNGPAKIRYVWRFSDGGESDQDIMEFEEAGTKTTSIIWHMRGDDKQVQRKISIAVLGPQPKEWPGYTFTHTCN